MARPRSTVRPVHSTHDRNQRNWLWLQPQVDDLWTAIEGFRGIWYNVKDPRFGAKGDGTRDETAAVQAAVDAAVEAAALSGFGAVIFFPPGIYIIDGEILIPNDFSVIFLGSGMGWTGNGGESLRGKITYIRRTAAGYTDLVSMFRAPGLTTDRSNVSFQNMLIDGKSATNITEAKPILEITNSVEVLLRNVQVRDHSDVDGDGWPAIHIFSAFNMTMDNVYVTDCGSPGDFTGSAGQGAGMWIGGATITVNGTNLEFEGCEGTDLWIGADSGGATSQIQISNMKMERGGINDSAGKPHLRLGPLCQGIQLANIFIPSFRAVPHIVQDTPAATPTFITNLMMTVPDNANDKPDYLIDVQDGNMRITNGYFSSSSGDGPNEAYVHVGPDAEDFSFLGDSDDHVPLVVDER